MLKTIDNNLVIEIEYLDIKYNILTTTKYSQLFQVLDSEDSKNTKKYMINHNLLKEDFGIERVLIPKQNHTNNIEFVNKSTKGSLLCDGLLTKEKNIAIGILTADCYTVQIFGQNIISNIHCGWRGIYSGIIEKTIDAIRTKNETILGAIVGVGICEKCYTVDINLIIKFQNLYKDIFYYKDINGKFHLSLRHIVDKILKLNEVTNIYHLDYCSSCSKMLYSYRRDNKTIKRMLTLAWMK